MNSDGVVAICSRGLVHSRTEESVEMNLRPRRRAGEVWYVEHTHDLPIPVAQTEITERALRHNPEFVWFVEEDNVIPSGTLFHMRQLAEKHDVVVADYPLKDGNRSIYKSDKGSVLFGGMGCLLARARVFQLI